MDPQRQRRIIREITDHAPRYAGPHCPVPGMGPSDAARYVVEGHIPDATSAEWDWVGDYLRAHQDVLDRQPSTLGEVEAERLAEARTRSKTAADRFRAGAHAEALDEIEQCAWLAPRAAPWAQREARIRAAMAETVVADPARPDDWQCPPPCGNTADSAGFFPIEGGAEVEPTPAAWTGGLYCCAGCGRLVKVEGGRLVGRVDLAAVTRI